jgi:hypothetical protein
VHCKEPGNQVDDATCSQYNSQLSSPADIKEDSGIISFRKSGPDKVHEHIAGIKRLVGSDGKFFPLLEAFEQNFISEESECCKLRKILEGMLLRVVYLSLQFERMR